MVPSESIKTSFSDTCDDDDDDDDDDGDDNDNDEILLWNGWPMKGI